MFVWRPLAVLTGTLLLMACSSKPPLPPFTASGYIADQGVVRIWRKDNSDDDTIRMLTAFSPRQKGATTTSDYRWQGEQLISIEMTILSQPSEHVKVRFDDHGELSFMQREVDGQKQQLSNDQIALYQYQASQMKATSEALRTGRVVLRQGRWHSNGTVTTCEGETIEPNLDSAALSHIANRQRHSSMDVSIAWLEAPEGSQLLLVANQDFCSWQPKPAKF
ncbi:YjaH family protein [Buttiauxella ferragutiae ATCC 51602]|uniref:YjaH family protein n=1 Tax=Buttiauxella ferragutiae ATCC 51602 TaxID=1354252 RepID=A0ABX2WCL6_9ENTR|nr:YjaH family protein [Buttiauxella ferragutiae ATCC 51602]